MAAGLTAAAMLLFVGAAAAETFVIGRVVDAVTKQPIAGAELSVRFGPNVLGGPITSGPDGAFRVSFAVPAAERVATLTLVATATGFDQHGSDFQVVDGEVRNRVDASLYPAGILQCRPYPSRRSVVVGHFLAPLGETWPDLPERVALKLDFGLGPLVQSVAISRDHLPVFIACGAARANRATGASFARELGADALVAGIVAGSAPGFVVTTYVADGHGLYSNPPTVRSANVNLDDPWSGPLGHETFVAVLAAVAAGLRAKGDCVGALTILNAAEQVAPTVDADVSDLRRHSEAAVPNAGLLLRSNDMRALLLAVLLLATLPMGLALAGMAADFDREFARLEAIRRTIEAMPAYREAQTLRERLDNLTAAVEEATYRDDERQREEIRFEITRLERELAARLLEIDDARERMAGEAGTRFFGSVRNRLAAFAFDDPDGTELGEPISSLLAKELLFGAPVSS